jgi:hypothetical protein
MKAATTPRSPIHLPLGGIALALGLAVVLGGAYAAPARADDRRGHDVQRAHHERGRDDHRSHGYAQPVYAPPVAYYDAPVAPPALDFVFPLVIR